MTTKPNAAPWADEPYKLIPINKPEPNEHHAKFCAYEMSLSHNCLTRGLNAIVQQAPHIPEFGETGYNEQDVKDLLFYVEAWTVTVDHHHMTEETTMFPAMAKLAGNPELMAVPLEQHEAFHGGLIELQEYAKTTGERPEDYTWGTLKTIIDGFAPALIEHLSEELPVLLAMEKTCDSEGLKKAWADAEAVAKANGNMELLYEMFPLVLGTCDKTYNGGNEFPPLPAPINYAIKYWFGRRHAGAWRFNPCDYWGQPVPLPMLPEHRTK